MSRAEAIEQYGNALRQGKKYYAACTARGVSPYPRVLDEEVNVSALSTVRIGLTDIPADRIVGTWAKGRMAAFAGNFMPLLDMNTEFGAKWVALCEAHLDEGGITDPITCYEYLGNFYVQEGHKRVSVLKSYDAPVIPGVVTRVLPAPSDDPAVQRYQEFLQFYKVSRLYTASFSQPGGFIRLQAALGLAPDQEWPEETRRTFSSDYHRFSAVFDQLNAEKLPLTAGDALLAYLAVHPYAEMQKQTGDQLRAALAEIWPDVRLIAQGEPISVSTEPEEKEKSLLTRILGGPRLHAAFFYDFDPQTSTWAAGHAQGQKALEQHFGASVHVSDYLCGEHPLETMEKAVGQGVNVLFATSPTLIDACRRIAAGHKGLAVFCCSLTLPYAGVRSYYCRIYEGKFIAGAIAAAMARQDTIGYVANYPIMGVPASINAFALGARLTNPRAKIRLKWSCVPGNPILEFKDEGITVISNRDEDGADTRLAWDLGTYMVHGDGSLQPLASPRWNWGSYYVKTVQSLLNGGVDALRDSQRAVNDWWGISSGVVSIAMDPDLPDGMKRLCRILKDGIVSEAIDPFLCPIRDQQGREISSGERRFTPEELMRMDWLCDCVEGRIPAFDELLPRSQRLVRLLGLYRDSIPPQAEDAAL